MKIVIENKSLKEIDCSDEFFDSLRSDYYKYLRLRGLVSDVKIVEMRAGVPAMNDSSIKVVLVRITLEVTYDEVAPIIRGETLELIPVQISDDNGQVVVDIK